MTTERYKQLCESLKKIKDMTKNYLMIRAINSKPKDFKTFFKNKVVAVGWSEIDFTQY